MLDTAVAKGFFLFSHTCLVGIGCFVVLFVLSSLSRLTNHEVEMIRGIEHYQ